MTNKITITKRIAKQGKNSVIIIPTYLREHLKAGSIVQIEITTLQEQAQEPVETEEVED